MRITPSRLWSFAPYPASASPTRPHKHGRMHSTHTYTHTHTHTHSHMCTHGLADTYRLTHASTPPPPVPGTHTHIHALTHSHSRAKVSRPLRPCTHTRCACAAERADGAATIEWLKQQEWFRRSPAPRQHCPLRTQRASPACAEQRPLRPIARARVFCSDICQSACCSYRRASLGRRARARRQV